MYGNATVEIALLEECEQAARDPRFRNNWEYVQLWSEQSRYRRHRLESARALLEAVGDRSHGVISWIKQRW